MKFSKWAPRVALLLFSTVEAKEWLIPAYFHPFDHGVEWQQLTSAVAAGEKITVILNPENGPGRAPDPLYQQVVAQFKQAGGQVLGYIPSCYFKAFKNYPYNWCRDLSIDEIKVKIQADADRYFAWYGVDGIFLDEVTGDPSVLNHYVDVVAYIRQNYPDALVFANPGTDYQAEPLLQPFDAIVTYEADDVLSPYGLYQPPNWVDHYPAERFAHLVYNVMNVHRAKRYLATDKHNGYIYVTDDGLDGNPWDSLPNYWNALKGIQPLEISWNGTLLTLKARFPQTGSFHQLFLNLDGLTVTGYSLQNLGADVLVENGYLHRYSGGGADWSWQFVSSLPFFQSSDLVTWTLPFPKLLEPQATASVDGSPESRPPTLRVVGDRLVATVTWTRSGSFYQLFLDLDRSPQTGFAFAGLGADYLAENGHLFRYSGQGNDWSWQYVGSIPFSGTAWEIPLTVLSYPDSLSILAVLGQDGSRWSAPFVIH